MTSPLAAAAAQYLALGLSVISLTGKTPNVRVHRHGLSEPLTGAPEDEGDFALLDSVFDHDDITGVGILTNYPYVVVDIDGPEGAEQWAQLVGVVDTLDSATWVAKTARGLHLWYSCLTPTGTIKLGPQLDLKGNGGYVAVPPSLHPEGATYEWLVPPSALAPPKEVPEPLLELIENHVFDMQGRLAAKAVRNRAWGPKYVSGDKTFYAQANHDALIEGMSKAAEGNRNNYLHWAAATLGEEGGSDDEFVLLATSAIALGLDRVEVKRTIRSARRANV